jgi:hypothetical protein
MQGRDSTFAIVERTAAAQIEMEFSRWGWLFRQMPADLGIDAQVEPVDDGFPSGRLISLVFKAGDTYFAEAVAEGWLYRGSNAQLLYCLRHSLPVVILVYHPGTRATYWAHVTSGAVEYTRSGWKMLIPSAQVLGPEALRAFRALTDPATAVASGDTWTRMRWLSADRAVIRAIATAAEPVGQPAAEEFRYWVGTLIDRFQHAVEDSDLWRALWDDRLTKPRGEKIVQAIAGTMWSILCEFADVDIAREANAGRGPVDFKFSAGWHRRALIEVKLLSSSKLRRGAEAQLPQYMTSEQVSCAYYVCVGFTDDDLRRERLDLVRDICAAYQARSGHTVTPRFIDARPKEPASRLSS